MTAVDLARVGACTFDCYGTIVDWEAGLLAALKPLIARAPVGPPDDAALLAAFADLEHREQESAPARRYPRILEAVARGIGERFGVAVGDAAARAFGASVGDWPPFADSAAALAALGRRVKLVVVSNVDRASFERTQARLGVAFDAIVTAEEVGAWKPDRRMFDAAIARVAQLGVAKDRILHVAQSLWHDHVPAQALGLRTAFVDRYRGRPGATPAAAVTPDLTVSNLRALAALFGV